MRKTAIGIGALVVGLLIGAIGGVSLGGGAMMGAGAASGLSMGICSTAQAAQDLGFLTSEQIDQVLNKAAQDMSGKEAPADGQEVVGSAEACAEVMAKLGQ